VKRSARPGAPGLDPLSASQVLGRRGAEPPLDQRRPLAAGLQSSNAEDTTDLFVVCTLTPYQVDRPLAPAAPWTGEPTREREPGS
jgi:hypothetical protein